MKKLGYGLLLATLVLSSSNVVSANNQNMGSIVTTPSKVAGASKINNAAVQSNIYLVNFDLQYGYAKRQYSGPMSFSSGTIKFQFDSLETSSSVDPKVFVTLFKKDSAGNYVELSNTFTVKRPVNGDGDIISFGINAVAGEKYYVELLNQSAEGTGTKPNAFGSLRVFAQ